MDGGERRGEADRGGGGGGGRGGQQGETRSVGGMEGYSSRERGQNRWGASGRFWGGAVGG